MGVHRGSIEEFLEEAGVEVGRLLQLKGSESVVDLIEGHTERPLLVDVNGIKALVGLVDSRRLLYKAIRALNDVEAYRRILEAESRASSGELGELVDESFTEYFEEREPTLFSKLAVVFYRGHPAYITSSTFIACLDKACNMSVHRVMVKDGRAAVRLVPRHLYRMVKASGGRLRVAIAIGLHPAVLLAAATSPPYGVFELDMVPHLLGAKLAVCRTPTYGLPVPCGASFVAEATIGSETLEEGPFIDVLGTPDAVRREPVLRVEKLYLNKVFTPYHHVIVPASCEHELLMGFPREAAIYAAVSRVSEVVKVRLTPASGMWLHAVVAIRKRVEGESVNAGLAALSAHPSLKAVIVVDDDIDPDNPYEVEWALATRVRWSRDITLVKSARGSTLDPSSDDGVTDKVVIDATAPVKDRERFKKLLSPTPRVKAPCT